MIKELFENNLWKELKPYCFNEEVPNQSRKNGPRYRRKISKLIPKSFLEECKKIRIKCCVCQREMKPVMESEDRDGPYLNVSCDFRNHPNGHKCSRSRKAWVEVLVLEAELRDGEPGDPRQQEIPF